MLLLDSRVSDSDANAWANAVQTEGGFVTGDQRQRVAKLIRSLKSSGVWTTLDRLWLFAAENSTQALTDLKTTAPAMLAHVTSTDPTFVVNRGFLGNADGYINTGFNPATADGNYARDNARFGGWAYQLGTGPNYALMGNDDSNVTEAIITPGSLYRYGVNTASLPSATTVAVGLAEFERTGASAQAAYLNGAANGISSGASIPLTNATFYALASNNGSGTPVHVGDFGISAAYIGAAQPSVGAMYAAMRAYMTAVGMP